MERLRKLSLVEQFGVASFLVILLLGLALAWVLGRAIKDNALAELAYEARDTLERRLIGKLTPEDFLQPMVGQRYANFHRWVEESIVSGRTARIKIWNPQGLLVYSDDATQVGKVYTIKEELATALAGRISSEISVLEAQENIPERAFGRLLEVYVPVTFLGSEDVVGAFEIYQFYEPVAAQTANLQRDAYAGLALGLGLLYLTLFAIVKRASDTLQHQQESLSTLYISTEALLSMRDTQQVLEHITRAATHLSHAESGALMLREEGKEELTPKALYNVFTGVSRTARYGIAEALVSKTIAEGRPLLESHPASPDGLAPPNEKEVQPRSALCVPLRMRDRIAGAFCLTSYSRYHAFGPQEVALVEELVGHASLALERARLVQELERRAQELQDSYDATLKSIAAALDLRDREVAGHSHRVQETTVAIAREMGLSEDEIGPLRWGALLHDSGKIGVADAILRKPGPLTPEEWQEMRQHPVLGYQMLSQVSFLRDALPIVLHHHEHYDGSGYPRGLAGEAIPLGARIFAVADAYEAMTTDRVYRKALSLEEVIAEIKRNAGTQFDPKVVEAFLRLQDRP